jgi:hypothetical protein
MLTPGARSLQNESGLKTRNGEISAAAAPMGVAAAPFNAGMDVDPS